MSKNLITPTTLAIRLAMYYLATIALVAGLAATLPGALDHMPLGGANQDIVRALKGNGVELAGTEAEESIGSRSAVALTLATYLLFTVALMIPVTWVYMATRQVSGYRQNFVFMLIIMPICVSSVVMLVQGSLALAFGLAAMVAAVRFRVALSDALEGIYVFAAIAVGLACGIGYAGVGFVMTLFFCFASVVMWQTGYGYNEDEVKKQEAKRQRREQRGTTGS
jgi:hypothetical protein